MPNCRKLACCQALPGCSCSIRVKNSISMIPMPWKMAGRRQRLPYYWRLTGGMTMPGIFRLIPDEKLCQKVANHAP